MGTRGQNCGFFSTYKQSSRSPPSRAAAPCTNCLSAAAAAAERNAWECQSVTPGPRREIAFCNGKTLGGGAKKFKYTTKLQCKRHDYFAL
jgi:hypothetical protein